MSGGCVLDDKWIRDRLIDTSWMMINVSVML